MGPERQRLCPGSQTQTQGSVSDLSLVAASYSPPGPRWATKGLPLPDRKSFCSFPDVSATDPVFSSVPVPKAVPQLFLPHPMTCREWAMGSFASDLMGNHCLLTSCFYTLSSNACFSALVVLWSFWFSSPVHPTKLKLYFFVIILNPCLGREMFLFHLSVVSPPLPLPPRAPWFISQMIVFSAEEINSKAVSANTT